MPYFVYRVQIDPDTGRKDLTHLETLANFKAARQIVRERRSAADARPEEFRMIFAHTEAEAGRLLTTPSEEKVIGED